MTNITIISENLKIKSRIEHYLGEEGYTIIVLDGEEDLSKIDLLLYDLSHFRENELSFIARTNLNHPLIPIIVFVNQGNIEATVKAMRAGAVNVLAMPVDRDLLIRTIQDELSRNMDVQNDQQVIQQAITLLQSIQIKYESSPAALSEPDFENRSAMYDRNGVLQLGDLSINIKQEKVIYQKIPVDLTLTQFRLLAVLAEEQGRVVPYEELYFRLHNNRIDRASSRTALSAHLSYLRTKLSDAGCRDYLENVRGRGYILAAPTKNAPTPYKK